MGVLSELFKLPFAPIRGLIAIGEIIRDQAESELRSPAAIRRDLEELDRQRQEGLITEEEAAEAEQQILNRMIEQPPEA
jgi:cytochrome c-type biogenesis protein CcmH/NrfG